MLTYVAKEGEASQIQVQGCKILDYVCCSCTWYRFSLQIKDILAGPNNFNSVCKGWDF